MALDHTRDFFGVPGISPTDPSRASAALFFTRWITNICAPVFFLLTGTGARLALRRTSVPALSRYLLTRGLWLIVLELTVVRCLGFQFNVDYRVTMLLVLWALGWAMIALSPLVFLPTWAVATYGVIMIAGHNLLDSIRFANPDLRRCSTRRASCSARSAASRVRVVSAHPVARCDRARASRLDAIVSSGRRPSGGDFLTWAGTAMIAAFVALRFVNVYGDPARWRDFLTTTATLLSFLNATKYPPSLLFLLMTLGPAFLALAALDRGTPAWLRPTITYGRVPLFYFVLHLPLIHLVAVAFSYARYGSAHWMFESPDLAHYPFSNPPGWGYSLPIVYAIWIAVVVMLYPACRWFAGVKARRREAWLSYV